MRFLKNSLIFLIFIGFSCQDVKHVSKPDNLIPMDKMVDILTEIVLVNSARNYNKIKLEQTGLKPDKYIYEKFSIDSVQFQKSNAYYSENYNDYVGIFDRVKDTLDTLKEHYNKLEEQEKAVKDSIKEKKLDKEAREIEDTIESIKEDKRTSVQKNRADSLKLREVQ
ncbi:DUF4296 domain-containing protein [Zunongwangia sp. HGR-M22]|uniref:DUF4296 domain-containing protein n=1 Tax=Zunongwangia sp. HGR-M22 TaxID=3015168 RepID=UPI0022DE6BA9|nr:DUF4296 domain-containing protein [Zunongwangia sp. HGR-M22]WBL25953.1 DUF4296 domain-containing protein [Zunongwangia sp. HGR-M22]